MISLRNSIIILAISIAIYKYFTISKVVIKDEIVGRRVVVTGASSGLGEQLAYEYARHGARIIITARGNERLQKVADKCQTLGAQKVDIVIADMNKSEDRNFLFQTIESKFDGVLDYLILNHASFRVSPWLGTAQSMTDLQKTLDVNFISYVDLSSRCLPLLKMSSGGRIGVISALLDRLPAPLLSTHSASKAALSAFFSAWRQELRRAEVDVSITLCILGLLATNSSIKQLQFTHLPELIRSFAVSTQDTAQAVVESVAIRDYYLFYPPYTTTLFTLHQWFPMAMENFGGYVVIP